MNMGANTHHIEQHLLGLERMRLASQFVGLRAQIHFGSYGRMTLPEVERLCENEEVNSRDEQ